MNEVVKRGAWVFCLSIGWEGVSFVVWFERTASSLEYLCFSCWVLCVWLIAKWVFSHYFAFPSKDGQITFNKDLLATCLKRKSHWLLREAIGINRWKSLRPKQWIRINRIIYHYDSTCELRGRDEIKGSQPSISVSLSKSLVLHCCVMNVLRTRRRGCLSWRWHKFFIDVGMSFDYSVKHSFELLRQTKLCKYVMPIYVRNLVLWRCVTFRFVIYIIGEENLSDRDSTGNGFERINFAVIRMNGVVKRYVSKQPKIPHSINDYTNWVYDLERFFFSRRTQ